MIYVIYEDICHELNKVPEQHVLPSVPFPSAGDEVGLPY